jgi:hypothetical protein
MEWKYLYYAERAEKNNVCVCAVFFTFSEAYMFRCKTNRNIKHLKTKHRPLYLKTQYVPRGKHFSSRL